MREVITIGREFGSGGREFGRRLADLLQMDYYDKEIITEISKRTKLAEDYVNSVLERRPRTLYPITIGRSILPMAVPPLPFDQSIFVEQKKIIQELAGRSPCVIVGRCADEILKEHDPLRIFVHADLESRVRRCQARRTPEETYSEKEWRQKIAEIDRDRSRYYEFYTGKTWGDRRNYDFCINTTNLDIKDFAAHFSQLYLAWKCKF